MRSKTEPLQSLPRVHSETLTWLQPADGELPDVDLEVLLHTDDQDRPFLCGAYQGDGCWIDDRGKQLRCRVLEWSVPGGSALGQGPFAELARVARRGRIARAPRPESVDPQADGVANCARGLLEARGWRCVPPAIAGLECACADTPAGQDFCPVHAP